MHKHEFQFPIFPHLIIIGAQKSGTTALNVALQKIPNFVESVWREPHFWDFEALPVLQKHRVAHRQQCSLAKQYLGCWDLRNATRSSILYEKTPSLLAIPSLARHMRSFMDKMHPNHPVKLVVLLRDPVERFYSHFKMDYARGYSRGVNQKRVGSVIREEMEELVQHGVVNAPVYHRQLPLDEIDGSSPNQTAPFRIGSRVPRDYKGFVARGFYSRQLRPYLKYFPLGESLMVVQYEEFKEKPVEVLERILKFVTGKDTPVSEEAKLAMQEDLGPRISTRKYYHPLTNHSEDYLRLLYQPFNEELVNILGESWRDVWTQ